MQIGPNKWYVVHETAINFIQTTYSCMNNQIIFCNIAIQPNSIPMNIMDSNVSDNMWGGIMTDNSNTVISNVNITGNGGYGVLDLSGNQPVRIYPARIYQNMPYILEKVRRDIFANPVFEKDKEELSKEISAVQTELKTEKPKASVLRRSFARMSDLTKNYVTDNTAKRIVDFAKNGSEVMDCLEKAGLLF